MIEAMLSSETSVLTRAIRRHIPEDGFLYWNIVATPKIISEAVDVQQLVLLLPSCA
jgi:hypothetical protein